MSGNLRAMALVTLSLGTCACLPDMPCNADSDCLQPLYRCDTRAPLGDGAGTCVLATPGAGSAASSSGGSSSAESFHPPSSATSAGDPCASCEGCCADSICLLPSLSRCGVKGSACMACDPRRADACSDQGTCACGKGPACPSGLECQDGACQCTPESCPDGCCAGLECRERTLASCGVEGAGCQACDPERTDGCGRDGACHCGKGAPCKLGQACEDGRCTCSARSCAGCCLEGLCQELSALHCGPAGASCVGCDPAVADGCSRSGHCACGHGSACQPGQRCQAGRCRCDPATCAGCCSGDACLARSAATCAPPGSACVACDEVRADRCSGSGACACGADAPCPSGLHCVDGHCACDAVGCPGCCAENQCTPGTVLACAPAGESCAPCAPVRADACGPGGSCMCGTGSACPPGQHCVEGACGCDSTSCPDGCCDGSGQCRNPGAQHCGILGAACQDCGARADSCGPSGECRCGSGTACAPGQRCQGGECRCDPASCPDGCCEGLQCTPRSLAACAEPGKTCAPCDARTADACSGSGTCSCGSGTACSPAGRCQAAHCVLRGMEVHGEGTTSPWPRFSLWDGEQWSAVLPAAAAAPTPRWMVLRSSPVTEEAVLAVLAANNRLFVQSWDGSSWTAAWDVAMAGCATRPFDVSYRAGSRDAVVLYADSAGQLRQRWSREGTWDAAASTVVTDLPGQANWVRALSSPEGSSLVALALTATRSLQVLRWVAGDWQDRTVLTGNATDPNKEGATVVFEHASGRALAIWGQRTAEVWSSTFQTAWSAPARAYAISDDPEWVVAAADPQATSSAAVLGVQSRDKRVILGAWNGAQWSAATPSQLTQDTGMRGVDVAFGSPPGQALAVLAADTGSRGVSWRAWTATGGFAPLLLLGATPSVVDVVQLRADPGADQVVLSVAHNNVELSRWRWSGGAWDAVALPVVTTLPGGGTCEPFMVSF